MFNIKLWGHVMGIFLNGEKNKMDKFHLVMVLICLIFLGVSRCFFFSFLLNSFFQRRHALRCYCQALQVYKGKGWRLAEVRMKNNESVYIWSVTSWPNNNQFVKNNQHIPLTSWNNRSPMADIQHSFILPCPIYLNVLDMISWHCGLCARYYIIILYNIIFISSWLLLRSQSIISSKLKMTYICNL